MNHEAARYEKALKKQLRCTGSTKKCLLQQFQDSLDSYLEEHPSPTRADLHEAFDTPENMAEVMMEVVSEAEVAQFEKQKKWKRFAAIALAALLLVLMMYVLLWKEVPIVGVDEVTDYGTITTEASNIE